MNILIIGHVWPEPSTTAAGKRMLQLVDAFLDFGYNITFGSTSSKTEFSYNLPSKGVDCVELQLNHSSFDEFLMELHPEIVLFDRFMTEEQFGWRVSEILPNTLRILNTEDLHSLRKSREEKTLGGWKQHPMTLRELASIFRSDLTLMISTVEVELLVKEAAVPESLLMHLPFMLDMPTEDEIKKWPSYEDRTDFVCVGNGKHAPNIHAIKTLKQEIWPLIRNEIPDAKLKIIGAYLPQQVLEMHKPKEGFEVMGWISNLDQVLQNARLLLAPIEFGAGIKGKLTDAMCNGTPNITTTIGAEGMYDDMPWSGAISHNWQEFVHNAVRLYQNEMVWKEAQANGFNIISRVYSKDKHRTALKERIKEIHTNLATNRNDNIIGRMLQQQGLAATKYMGKWIEEKNR